MKKRLYIGITSLLLFILTLSCTRPPHLAGRDKAPPDKNSGDRQQSGELDSSYDDFDLDRLNQEPIEITAGSDTAGNMSYAVDDYIWRELNSAFEFYSMGVLANREAAWEEAEYYFEKALAILGELDLDTETDTLLPEVIKYEGLLADIVANYRVTLLSLGHLPGDVSPDALKTRFTEVNHLKIDSSEFKKLDTLTPEKVTYNVPIVMNQRVKKSILYYQTVARDAVKRYLSRSTKYIPMIDSIFTAYGVPTDMKYLALVESGYNPHAYSWARAMGLWQFIASTGRIYNMNRSWWYDERKDPVKATVAAARFLKDLYDEFGSWELAMAAYNGGPGRVRRTIKKQKTTDFWKMRLRKQTMDYVPFFMAAVVISKNPEEFGFTDIDYQPRWQYDVVAIDKCLDFKVIAKAVGCTVDDIKELNPELLRRFTPPNIKKYKLRVPKGTKARFYAAYEKMPSSKETSFVRHKIRRGESVSTIARKYGVSQYAIFEANNLSRRSKIYAGKSLVIPVPNDRSYGGRSNREYEAEGNIYVVRSGDTVWDIARAFGTTPDKVRRLNKLDRRARIYVGQKLRIYDSGDSRIMASNDGGKDQTYKVRKGDTLWEIARKYGTTTASLRKINALRSGSRIYPGQILKIAAGSTGGSNYQIYTVKKGDTLWDIATLFGTTVSRLIAWNNVINPDRLRTGERLVIYTN